MSLRFCAASVIFLALIFLSLAWAEEQGRDKVSNAVQPVQPKPLLPLTFRHRDHVTSRCIDCHHNFIDNTGQGLCFECHQTHPDIAHLIEEQFHGLCRGCHEEKQLAQEVHGPTRHCELCHVADNEP